MGLSIGKVFGKPINRPLQESEVLLHQWAKVGVEVEVENCRRPMPLPNWEFKGDGSLRGGGVEYVTRGGLSGKALEEAILLLTKTAVEQGWSDGEPRAAIHVHLDVTDLGDKHDKQLSNLIAAYLLFEHAFFNMAGNWRRWCGFCDAAEDSRGDSFYWSTLLYGVRNADMMTEAAFSMSKYQALNMRPLAEFGTIEFRHLPTTFDDDRIFQWINCILMLKQFADSMPEEFDMLRWLGTVSMHEAGTFIFGKAWPALAGYSSNKAFVEAKLGIAALAVMWENRWKFDAYCSSTKITNPKVLSKMKTGGVEEPEEKKVYAKALAQDPIALGNLDWLAQELRNNAIRAGEPN